MAGLSKRFSNAGYLLPKYALPLHGKSVFEWSILSFNAYFHSEHFVFTILNDGFAKKFVESAIKRLGIKSFEIFTLSSQTRGQAETAYLTLLPHRTDFDFIVFNIDTIRYDYKKPEIIANCNGYLEVFHGDGDHWSFVEPGINHTVLRTTEKERISNLCSSGLYYFSSQLTFKSIFEEMLRKNITTLGEFYIAPLYNYLINAGQLVKYHEIQSHEIDFCGTPNEFRNLVGRIKLGID